MNDKDYIKDFKEKRIQKKPLDKKILIAIFGAVLLIIFLILILIPKTPKNVSDRIKDGYVSDETETSDTIKGLFYELDDDNYLVDIVSLDDAISADIIKTDNGYAIRTEKIQFTVVADSDSYYINSNKISDDSNYIKPVNVRGKLYADTRSIFDVFGYSIDYHVNTNNNVVEMKLTKTGTDNYVMITAKNEVPETIVPTEPQIEESAVNPENNINQPGSENILPTVPQPTMNSNVTEESEEAETEAEEPTPAETIPEVERSKEMPNRKTDEEFQQIWNKDSNDLTNIFQGGTPSYDNKPFEKRTDDFLAFNPMSGGIYYDTISVLHNPTSGEFIIATFSADWSDQEMNTPMEESKAYYRGIPAVYEATIKELLGQNAGTEFYNWIKAHADKMTTGGYISKFDENGKLISEWVDGEVGDGVMASSISFEDWSYKETDDGLRFDVTREGEGFVIRIYKN